MTPGPDGQPYDWTRVTAGHFQVHAQKHRPRAAEVAVPYRGYWFFIAPNDVNSRAALAILEIVFVLQESDGRSLGATNQLLRLVRRHNIYMFIFYAWLVIPLPPWIPTIHGGQDAKASEES